MRINVSILVLPLAMAACGDGGVSISVNINGSQPERFGVNNPPGNATVRIFKSSGAIQCYSKGISSIDMTRELTDAGICVLSASCGNDGMVHPAVCGVADGSINVFEIPADQLNQAKALSFAPLSNLPQAQLLACR